MPKIKLYFENYLVDNTDNISIPLTKTFDNIQDPMKYYSEYSRSVDIPFSVNNNKLFNHIFNVDIVHNSDPEQPNIGHNFDPKRKIPFRIEHNGDVILEGYAKLNSITYANGGKYNITLFGKFGEIMQELHKLTFINPESNKYYIVSPKYDRISANFVKSAMLEYPSSTFSQDSFSLTDIITFFTNEGVYENFDMKKNVIYKISDNTIIPHMNIVDTSSFLKETYTYISNNNINPESIVGDAMLPGTWEEYRSYYQIPCMWVKRLWEMFIAAATKVTSYSFDLDHDFFNGLNPLYSKQVLVLKPFNTKKESNYTSTFNINTSKNRTWMNGTNTNKIPSNIIRTSTVSDEYAAGYDDIPDGQVTDALFLKSKPDSYDTFTINFSQKYSIEFPSGGIEGKQYLSVPFYIDVNLKTKDGLIINTCKYEVHRCKYEGLEEYDKYVPYSKLRNIILQDTYQEINPSSETTSLFFTLNYSYRTSQVINGCYIEIVMYWENIPFYFTYDPELLTNNDGVQYIHDKMHSLKDTELVYVKPISELYKGEKNRLSVVISQKEKRSGDYFSISDLWDKNVNPLEYLLEFSKIYGLVWNIDEKNKTIVVRQQQNDYKEGLTQGVRDYTDNVDNREKVLKPAQFDCKYVRFNYADNKTALGTEYKNAYGANYGELILNNGNEFNTSEKKLFSGLIPAPITGKKQIFKIKTPNNIYSTIYPDTQTYTSMITTDKSNKTVDLFGSLFFVSTNTPRIVLTDDCNSEYFSNTYCYNRYGSDVSSTNVVAKTASAISFIIYPNKKITNLFNIPNITYGEDFKNVKSIYELFWKDYFDERYSYKNKVVEVKMKLSIEDYNTIRRGTFIKIDNQLYVFNKISDFDIQGDGLTKCELLTVNNLDAYTNNLFLTYMHS